MAKKELRYALKDGDGAESRFATAYEAGRHGKGSFVSECIAAGYMLKETGLLDALMLLDQDPSYAEMSALDKRAALLGMLSGSAAPAAKPAAEAPVAAPKSAPQVARPNTRPAPLQAKKKSPMGGMGMGARATTDGNQ